MPRRIRTYEEERYECPECEADITDDLIDEGLLDEEDIESEEEESD